MAGEAALKEERAAAPAALEAALAKLRAEIEPRKKPDLGAQIRVGGRASLRCGAGLRGVWGNSGR